MADASILAEIAGLAERVEQAINAAGGAFRPERVASRLTAAVLEILDRYPLADLAALSPADLERIIAEAVRSVLGEASTDVARDVAARSSEAVRAAADFYARRGVSTGSISEAVRRGTIARRISDAFAEGMQSINTELYEATRDVTLATVTRGIVSRSLIESEITERTGIAGSKARVQAGVAVGAYAEAWTEELARQAELGHLHYAGTLKANSRHFCRVHLDRVFTLDHVELMDNGQGLSPVRIFRGGHRCRHRWTPVNPDWSPELRARTVPDDTPATRVQTDRAGNRFITVVVPTNEIPRLERQIVLGRKRDGEPVYTVFENAPDNPTGFRAYHDQWLGERLNAPFESDRRRDMANEAGAAEGLARNGHEALLPPRPPELTNRNELGDVDVVWNGRPTEVKTPTALDAGSLSRPLKSRQSDLHLISLTGPLSDEPGALRRLNDWLDRNPGNEVWILHRYDDDRLTGPYDDEHRP